MREHFQHKGETGKKGEEQDRTKKRKKWKGIFEKETKNMKGVGQRKRVEG
jgi:hypothetical protein